MGKSGGYGTGVSREDASARQRVEKQQLGMVAPKIVTEGAQPQERSGGKTEAEIWGREDGKVEVCG